MAENDEYRMRSAWVLDLLAGDPGDGTYERSVSLDSDVVKWERQRPVIEHIANELRHGHSYHVSPDMSALVRGAAAQLARSEHPTVSFPPEFMPTAGGFACWPSTDDSIVVESPTITDGRYQIVVPLNVVGLSWGPCPMPDGSAGYRLTAYSTVLNHASWLVTALEQLEESTRRSAEESKVNIIKVLEGLPGDMTFDDVDRAARSFMVGDRQWTTPRVTSPEGIGIFFGMVEEWVKVLESLAKLDDVPASTRYRTGERVPVASGLSRISRFQLVPVISTVWPASPTDLESASDMVQQVVALVWTFLHFCGQTVTTMDDERPARPAARRWRDMPIPKMVTVVRLRRSSTRQENMGGGNVTWHHRWLVRGHWRLQPCGPGRTERRPVWVHEHVKGPDGLPLLITNKVYDLVR
jgi:hypothetical protein